MAVTDTTELQKKYDEEQAKKKGVDKVIEKKKNKDGKDKGDKEKDDSAKDDKDKGRKELVEGPKAADSIREPQPPATASPKTSPKPNVEGFDDKIQLAIKELQSKDYAAADLLLEELEKERKNDLNVLILKAAAQNGLKYHLAARRTLEKAMRAHPKSYLPYYNLAYLMFKIEGEGVDSARQYYELGRDRGGPRDEKLEKRLK